MAWIDSLLFKMVEANASDLHLSSTVHPLIRLHGEMEVIEGTEPLDPRDLFDHLQEIAPERNWLEFTEQWDSDFAYELEGAGRFRVNLFMDHKGPGAVMRVIPTKIPSASDLKLPAAILEMCRHSKGLVLVTGPTGSGKSTTLAAMLDHINETRREHVITVEDPIEFVHPNKRCLVNQREVHRHTGSFARALRAALREDPDIVLVGEMRDLETVKIAIETAETGHLVFGTLHTTTAATTVDRIIDQFPAEQQSQIRMMLSNSLRGVISQTLCKKIGGGRVAAQEILVVNNAVASLVREGKTHQIVSSMQIGGREGMRLMNDVLMDHVAGGRVEPMEAYMKAGNKDDMRTKLEAAGHRVDQVQAAPKLSAQHAPGPAPAMRPSPATGVSHEAPPPVPAPQESPEPATAGGPGYVDPFEEFRRKRTK
jgi:twitching motility protein PilT